MGFYFEILIGILAISNSFVWAGAECDPTDCRYLRDRLDTLEAVVRGLISIVASQKKGEELRGILALSASLNSSKNKTIPIVGEDERPNKIAVNLVNNLKGAVRCSLANLLDINGLDDDRINPSGKIEATLGENNLLQIVWTPLLTDCIKFSSGVWIRVFESDQQQPSSADSYLVIPQKCLKRHANASFTIALPSSSPKLSGNTCHFDLKDALIQCRVYTIEVVPNYQTLKGKPLITDIVIPPSNDNSSSRMESLISLASNSSSLTLMWKDNSGCVPELTGLHLKIFPDGEDAAENATMFFRVSSYSLEQPTDDFNVFSLSLFNYRIISYRKEWMPLDPCRRYKIEIKSEYSNTWTRAPSLWETFTVDQGADAFTQMNPAVQENQLDCPSDHFDCDDECQPYSWICDGVRSCDYVDDELHCNRECINGFLCGRQCIPTYMVCDGEYDCFDRSDESDSCDYRRNQGGRCKQLTTPSGHLNSQMIMCHKDNVQLIFKKVVLITVPINHTIWLSFNTYVNLRNQTLKIYDGPYLTSPLLLSYNGTTKPPSVRSSSNNLYVEFQATHCHRKFMIGIDYTSMDMVSMKLEPFVPGCGGYVYDEGAVSSPNNFADNATECVWFVEAQQSDKGMFFRRRLSPNANLYHLVEHLIMTVYDGWNSTGHVLYEGEVSSNPKASDILYSISHKMMIRFAWPKWASTATTAHWDVATISLREKIVVGSTGKIESPNYPAAYPNSAYDYRWNIVTEPGTKVQLLFAFFKTEEKFDFVFVYDGSTVKSPLILEKSGLPSTPFTLTSSSNELLVRFTSDDHFALPGFLAVYSTV